MKFFKDDISSDLKFKESVAIDTEAMGLNFRKNRLCMIQLCGKDNDNASLIQISKSTLKSNNCCENLKKLLTDKSILKIFHYARFDVALLRQSLGVDVYPVYCTKIASKLCRTFTDRHSLKALAKDLLGVELCKQEQSSDWGADKLTENQLKYAAADVIYLHAIKEKLDNMLKREGLSDVARDAFDMLQLITKLDLMEVKFEELFNH